jgi:adenylate kinase family enzyme
VPTPPQRWWFVGTSGSGKTTYARIVARELALEHVELDSIYHQPEWTPLESDAFQAAVAARLAAPAWTVCGNYRAVQAPIMNRVEVIVALELPRSVVMRQVISRTVRRGVRREVLWNDNRESLRNVLRWNPERNIVRWAWTSHHRVIARNRQLEVEAGTRGINFVRVRTHADARDALANLTGRQPATYLH